MNDTDQARPISMKPQAAKPTMQTAAMAEAINKMGHVLSLSCCIGYNQSDNDTHKPRQIICKRENECWSNKGRDD